MTLLPVKEPRPIISGWIKERVLYASVEDAVPAVDEGGISEGQFSLVGGGFVEGVEKTSIFMRCPTNPCLSRLSVGHVYESRHMRGTISPILFTSWRKAKEPVLPAAT